MSNICQWCSNTSSKVESMEDEIKVLRKERDALKDNSADMNAKVALAEIEARAIEGAIENFVNSMGMNEVFIHLADLQGYADELRKKAGEQK